MPKARGPLWWYELRYGGGWQNPVAIGLVALALIVAVLSGFPPWLAQRQKAMEARCIATGGRIAYERTPRGGAVIPICYRD